MTGYRKLMATGVVFTVATVMTFLHYLTGTEWITVASICLGIFVGGNVWSKFSPAAKGGGDGK